ncbi:MAG: hypothetical protein EG822_11420 [Deltaproteobacteria bacterium]|nr:hypothetical protein [Deltaproteobacteria bacterium]TLN01661.1 MAG: hypothetical protein FDZ73_14975 [bacterium]
MADSKKITVSISRDAARYVQPDTPKSEKLKAVQGEVKFLPAEIPLVLYYLSRDPDPEIRSAAVSGLHGLSGQLLLEICDDRSVHPGILLLLAKIHGKKQKVAEVISLNPAADDQTLRYLADCSQQTNENTSTSSDPESETAEGDASEESFAEELEDEVEEEFKSTYQLAMDMGVSEKIKMALTGDKEWRMLLVKDKNKLVSGSVIKNPRITEGEVLIITKCQLNNDDILREICNNKDWTKNYQIRKSLVENSKTPIQYTLRFLSGLTVKDLGLLAKSKNVSSVIATQARRLLMNKEKEK